MPITRSSSLLCAPACAGGYAKTVEQLQTRDALAEGIGLDRRLQPMRSRATRGDAVEPKRNRMDWARACGPCIGGMQSFGAKNSTSTGSAMWSKSASCNKQNESE